MPATWQPRPGAKNLHIISLTHRERESVRALQTIRTAEFFGRSRLQLMTSRHTVVYRYHGMLRRYIIVGYFLITHFPKRSTPTLYYSVIPVLFRNSLARYQRQVYCVPWAHEEYEQMTLLQYSFIKIDTYLITTAFNIINTQNYNKKRQHMLHILCS